jgi:hypothetical protein
MAGALQPARRKLLQQDTKGVHHPSLRLMNVLNRLVPPPAVLTRAGLPSRASAHLRMVVVLASLIVGSTHSGRLAC